MRRELLDLASDLAHRGEPFALATVVARKPPISAQVGDMAFVTGDAFHGWVGGSCTRPTVTALPELATAVSRAGGCGVLGASRPAPEEIHRRIRFMREATDRPLART